MGIKQQVPNLDLCKRLKDLGFEQETYLLWEYDKSFPDSEEKIIPYDIFILRNQPDRYKYLIAPTVTELGEALPIEFEYKYKIANNKKTTVTYNCKWYSLAMSDGTWNCFVYDTTEGEVMDFGNNGLEFDGATEADARAKLWIYLKENKII